MNPSSCDANAGLAILNQKFLVNIAGWLSFISDSVYGAAAPAAGASAAAAASAGRRLLVRFLLCLLLLSPLLVEQSLLSCLEPTRQSLALMGSTCDLSLLSLSSVFFL